MDHLYQNRPSSNLIGSLGSPSRESCPPLRVPQEAHLGLLSLCIPVAFSPSSSVDTPGAALQVVGPLRQQDQNARRRDVSIDVRVRTCIPHRALTGDLRIDGGGLRICMLCLASAIVAVLDSTPPSRCVVYSPAPCFVLSPPTAMRSAPVGG
jgi:hypothetical protein